MALKEAIASNGNGIATEHLEDYDTHRSVDLYLSVQDPDVYSELAKRKEAGTF